MPRDRGYTVIGAREIMSSARTVCDGDGDPQQPRRAPTPQATRPRCEDPECSAAGYIPAYDGGFYCPRCFHRRTAAWRRENRAAGLCACGRAQTPGYKTCARCRTKNNQRDWHRRMRRRYGPLVKGWYTMYSTTSPGR